MTSSNKLVASAILAVYNAQSTILPCIESLLGQSAKVEIIVVDDGSTDGTLKKLSIYKDITILKQSHGGPALARNLGSSHANSDILLFVDADMIFDRDYVSTLIKPIVSGEVIGTYTTEEQVSNWDNVWARCLNVQEGWEDKKRFPKDPPKYGTDFRAILKSEFDKVGGFDNIGYTDTWSLFNKLNVRPLATKAICYHKNPDTLVSVFRQARWAAKRPYKYGILGTLYALIRTSLPISIIVGIAKVYKEPFFVIFKIVYDLGRFVGLIEMLFTGKLAK
jgi:glycosyltransferase involved in cell wall biosynthesis